MIQTLDPTLKPLISPSLLSGFYTHPLPTLALFPGHSPKGRQVRGQEKRLIQKGSVITARKVSLLGPDQEWFDSKISQCPVSLLAWGSNVGGCQMVAIKLQFQIERVSLLVSQGFHNKYQNLSGLTQHNYIISQFWKPEVQHQGVSRAMVFLMAVGENPSLILPSSGIYHIT